MQGDLEDVKVVRLRPSWAFCRAAGGGAAFLAPSPHETQPRLTRRRACGPPAGLQRISHLPLLLAVGRARCRSGPSSPLRAGGVAPGGVDSWHCAVCSQFQAV